MSKVHGCNFDLKKYSHLVGYMGLPLALFSVPLTWSAQNVGSFSTGTTRLLSPLIKSLTALTYSYGDHIRKSAVMKKAIKIFLFKNVKKLF